MGSGESREEHHHHQHICKSDREAELEQQRLQAESAAKLAEEKRKADLEYQQKKAVQDAQLAEARKKGEREKVLQDHKMAEEKKQKEWERQQREKQAEWERKQAEEKQRRETQEQDRLKLALNANHVEEQVASKAQSEFGKYDEWPQGVVVGKACQHQVVLKYSALRDLNEIVKHVEKMFSEMPKSFQNELVQMASNSLEVVDSCKAVTEVADCRKQEVSYNIPEVQKNYSVRYAMAFQCIKATKEHCSKAGMLDWFHKAPPDDKLLVAIAYNAEIATAPMVEGAVSKADVDALKDMGLF